MGLDYIPEDVTEEVRQELLEMSEESPLGELSEVEVCEYLVRHWCETLEDGNPLYLDPEFARSKGHPNIVAPPWMLNTFTGPFRWPWPEKKDQAEKPTGHNHIKKLLNLPVGIVADAEMEFYHYLNLGDRFRSTTKLAWISPWKKTRLGEGRFWAFDTLTYNQNGELVARIRHAFFGYGRRASPERTRA